MTTAASRLRLLRPVYAVIDRDGTIVNVSPAWREFARVNGARKSADVGASYFEHCPAEVTGDLVPQLRKLMAGKASVVTYLYPCHSPDIRRWFVLVAIPGGLRRSGKATLIHIDVSQVLKQLPSAQLRELIGNLSAAVPLREQDVVSAGLLGAIGEFLADGHGAGTDGAAHVSRADFLTPTEERVAGLISRGKSNEEIARAVGCARNTVKRHVSSILRKLQVQNRTQVAARIRINRGRAPRKTP